MQQGVQFEQYLTTYQSIPATFMIHQFIHYFHQNRIIRCQQLWQDRSKHETKIYCRLVFILISKAHATGDGVRTIFDYMPKHSSYIHDWSLIHLMSHNLDQFLPILHEYSSETDLKCTQPLHILIAQAHVRGGSVSTIFDYMPKHSSYIQNTPVSITIIKIGPISCQ